MKVTWVCQKLVKLDPVEGDGNELEMVGPHGHWEFYKKPKTTPAGVWLLGSLSSTKACQNIVITVIDFFLPSDAQNVTRIWKKGVDIPTVPCFSPSCLRGSISGKKQTYLFYTIPLKLLGQKHTGVSVSSITSIIYNIFTVSSNKNQSI